MKTSRLVTVRGSGNVFRDLGRIDGDVQQTKALLAARIIKILDEELLTAQQAEARTGVKHSDFSKIRSAKLSGFTMDRLAGVLEKLDR